MEIATTNKIQKAEDIPHVLHHRIGEWLSFSDLNFIVGIHLHPLSIDTLRDTGITNTDKVAQNICIDAFQKGIIEKDSFMGCFCRIVPQ